MRTNRGIDLPPPRSPNGAWGRLRIHLLVAIALWLACHLERVGHVGASLVCFVVSFAVLWASNEMDRW